MLDLDRCRKVRIGYLVAATSRSQPLLMCIAVSGSGSLRFIVIRWMSSCSLRHYSILPASKLTPNRSFSIRASSVPPASESYFDSSAGELLTDGGLVDVELCGNVLQ